MFRQMLLAVATETPSTQSKLNGVLLIVIGAIVTFFFTLVLRKLDRIEKAQKDQQACIDERDMLLFEVDAAVIDVGLVTAIAVRDGKNNGNLIEAIKHLAEVKEKRLEFLTKMAQRAYRTHKL